MKILTIIGARPQFIKAAPISIALRKTKGIEEILLHTGQHFDLNMSENFFKELSIPKPDFMLDINGNSHGVMTGRMLEKIEKILIKTNPDRVLVYGDTNSTLAGALAASKINIPIAHIEAGLRSFNMKMPEEINRVLTDHLSDTLFCPTDAAVKNLNAEGIKSTDVSIIRTGDLMTDSIMFFKDKALKPKKLSVMNNFILCTFHRAENTDDPNRLKKIINALNSLHKDIPIVLPMHPRTKNVIAKHGFDLYVKILPPVSYFEMLWLLNNCGLVLTDSGGLQKEAYMSGKICLTLRNETEWVELIQSGVNFLTGSDTNKIILLAKTYFGQSVSTPKSFYGNGDAASQIVSTITKN